MTIRITDRSRNTRRMRALACMLLLAGPVTAAEPKAPGKFTIAEKSFHCMTNMTQVGDFYVDNLAGNLPGTVRVAKSGSPGIYPVGSVVQLVPTEVMIKREKGFNPATRDWEFFELDVSKDGSKIRTRGFAEVNNRFGGNCFGCHVKAHPEWDLICQVNHGCDPIPITHDMIGALQRTDPRCKSQGPVSAQDAAALAQLGEIVKAMKAANAPKQ